jgi:hypothetical protein
MPDSTEQEYTNFYEELPADGDPIPDEGDAPVDEEPAGGDEGQPIDTGKEEPQGDEDDEDGDEPAKHDPTNQQVPFKKFQKTRNQLKEERDKRESVERELEEYRSGKKKPEPVADAPDEGNGDDDEDVELDAASQRAIEKLLKQKGVLTKEAVEREERLTAARAQVEADQTELKGWATDKGYPEFDAPAVDKWADEHLGTGFVKNKKTLRAAYREMHSDAIAEADRKAALADAQAATATGEKPGAGAKPDAPVDSAPRKNAIGGMIHNAMKEISPGK